ncbi:MAG: acyltransferase [Planctomycetaceae bacterium]
MKHVAKTILRTISLLVMAPLLLLYHSHRLIAGADSALPGWSQLISLLPGRCGIYLRHAFYRCSLNRCDTDASIGFGTIFSSAKASIGRTAYIGNFCSIGDVNIGDDVLIASHVSIMNGCRQHCIDRLDVPVREQPGVYDPIAIGEDTWIGERATVAASVGRHCVIGAGSLVLAPVPDYGIAVGVPAKVIRDRRDNVPPQPSHASTSGDAD